MAYKKQLFDGKIGDLIDAWCIGIDQQLEFFSMCIDGGRGDQSNLLGNQIKFLCKLFELIDFPLDLNFPLPEKSRNFFLWRGDGI